MTKLNLEEMDLRELNMDEMMEVVGGTEEDNGLSDWILDKTLGAVAGVLKDLISSHLPDTFEEFYRDYENHKAAWETAITATILAITGPIGVALYQTGNKKKFLRKVYDRMK